MSIKLVAFDCDGTLLNDNSQILDSSIEAVEKAKKKGCKVVLVTGRPYVSCKPILKKLGIDEKDHEYVALFHGALIQNTNGKTISSLPLTFKNFVDLDLFAVNQSVSMVGETPNYIYTTMGNIDLRTAFESYKNRLQIRVRTLHQLMDIQNNMNVLKVLLIGKTKQLTQIQHNLPQWLTDRFTIARSENYCIDISPKNIDKGWALQQLANQLNINRNEIIAFGNADNDIPMIKYAKYGVAMKNSSPNLLKAADIITKDNNHDGISAVLQKLIK